MSYIIRKNTPFISTKLTEKGRMKLAQGQLNFRYWALGDSEVNYGYEEIKDVNQHDDSLNKKSIIFTPKDNQPNLKYFLSKSSTGSPYIPLSESDIKVSQLIINNRAEERGFFDASGNTKDTAPFVVSTGTVPSDNFNGIDGGKTINIPGSNLTVGNFILFKLTNDTIGPLPLNSNTKPTQHLWYKIQAKNTTTYTLDRDLPLLANTATLIQYIEYASGEVYENGMANEGATPYWDSNTLTFDSTTNVQMDSVPMLNMNNIWATNIIGLDTETAEEFYKYGSNDMLGTRSPFLCYIDTISPSDVQLMDVCVDAAGNTVGSVTDGDNKAISVIHYTNNSISNHYGEFFYINDSGKTLELEIPDLMYHRRKFVGGTGTGDVMGMKFVSRGETFRIKNSEIEYVELIEDPTMVNGDPRVVGKILTQHQTIIIDDEEIVAALSYKSGRNWTLPELSLTLANPASGVGMLAQGETLYVSYVLEDTTQGVAYTLPCQKYAKITNNNVGTKDIAFTIGNIDELPYMRKRESGNYDGYGFSATNFKVLYQVVSGNNKPVSNAWKEHDFTSNTLTTTTNATIDPLNLVSQLPEANGFKLTKSFRDIDTIYVINDKLGLPNNSEPDKLQFGDERFFYGNLRTYIGASVYRTVFDIKISGNEFTHTTNPTRSLDNAANPPEIRVSEVGIYDSEQSLVFIGKLAEPLKLINGSTVTVELSMDF